MKSRAAYLVAGLLLVALAVWGPSLWSGSGDPADSHPAATATTGTTDPVSGLPEVAAGSLPPEAADTLSRIDRGGPYPYEEDGDVFLNKEGILPDREYGYYHEYTVDTPGATTRGARRIVTGSDGELYWTEDHYQSFERIHR